MHHAAMRFAVLVGAALALSACGGGGQSEQASGDEPAAGGGQVRPAPSGAAATPVAAAAAAPPASYAQCRSCHSVEPGRNMIGPSLHDIVGKPAAAVPGYAYSNALKASGLTWDAATLDAWLASPAKLVPGNKMVFAGQTNPAKRQEIIDYLAAQK